MMTYITILEIIATVAGILCVYLQTKEKIIAWPFGILSVSISVFIFFRSALYSDVILHIVYIFLNIYGWWNWAHARKSENEEAPILILAKQGYFIWPFIIICGTGLLGFIMKEYAGADLAYFDAFTTVGSLVAQYLLARKILQNWILWIVVDVVAINVYLYKGLHYFAFLFFIYLLLCIKGYLDWRKHLKVLTA
jgi:nicotinamide mononucleotide transporter